MAKKNRYKIEQTKSSGWNVVDTTVITKYIANNFEPAAYVLARGCTEDDAIEITQALNYYNNRDKD